MKEVALAAGVSSAAVSRVLHGRGDNIRVSEARAITIRRVAKELNYVPNALARSLRVNRTHTIGLLFENFRGLASGPQYIVELLDGVSETIFPRHYRLTILSEIDHDDVMGTLGDGHLDGVIWCKVARDCRMLDQIRSCPIPIVSLNASAPSTFVACDNAQGVGLALDHLAGLGHRDILFVHEEEETGAPDCIERREAFCDGLARRGLRGNVGAWNWDMSQFAAWHASRPRETAIFAWSERCAGDVINRAVQSGVEIPRDLSIVGFDSTTYCETTRPRLTAVRQRVSDMARHAAHTLLDLIETEANSVSSFLYPCTLDIRDSTAKPSSKRISHG